MIVVRREGTITSPGLEDGLWGEPTQPPLPLLTLAPSVLEAAVRRQATFTDLPSFSGGLENETFPFPFPSSSSPFSSISRLSESILDPSSVALSSPAQSITQTSPSSFPPPVTESTSNLSSPSPVPTASQSSSASAREGSSDSTPRPSGSSGSSIPTASPEPSKDGEGKGVPVGIAVGAALGALVAGGLIVLLILCIRRRKRRNRAAPSNALQEASGSNSVARQGPLTPFDRYENASTSELAFIQKGMAEELRRNPTTPGASEYPSEKARLAAASTNDLPVLLIDAQGLQRSNTSLTAPQTPWSASPSLSQTSLSSPMMPTTFPPVSITTSPSEYSASSASRYSLSSAYPSTRGGGLSPISSAGDPSSATTLIQRTPFSDPPPSLSGSETGSMPPLDPRTMQSVLNLEGLRQSDLEVLRRAIQLVSAGSGAATLAEPPPAYQAGPLPP